jgi:spermidine/putrescine transport system substrate-binding protein
LPLAASQIENRRLLDLRRRKRRFSRAHISAPSFRLARRAPADFFQRRAAIRCTSLEQTMKHLRSAIALALSTVLAFVLVSCSKTDAPKAPPPTELNVLARADYLPQEVIDNFVEETHIKIHLDTVPSNEAMQAKLTEGATKYDVIIAPDYLVEGLVKMNRLGALDFANISNFSGIMPEFKDQPFDPGNKFSVPYMSGVVGIIYNSDKIKTPIKTFNDVFKPDHAGRIVVMNDNRELVSCAMIAQGIPINDVTPENLSKVRPTVSQWVKLTKKDAGSATSDLQKGNADIGIISNGEAALLITNDKRFKFAVPEEGAHRSIDSFAIPADAPQKASAESFINFCLRPEVSKSISEKWPYTNPNGKAREMLSQEQLGNPASYPTVTKPQIFRDIAKANVEIEKLMTEIRSGG